MQALSRGAGRTPSKWQMREDEIGAVVGVEMKFADAGASERHHLIGGGRRGDERMRFRIALQSLEAVGEPLRHARAGLFGEARDLLEIADRHDARHDRNRNAARPRLVEKAEIDVIVEKELRNGARRAGVDLRLQRVEILLDRRAFGMSFRIGRNRNLEIADGANAAHEIGRRADSPADAARRPRRRPLGGSPRSATMWRTPASQ